LWWVLKILLVGTTQKNPYYEYWKMIDLVKLSYE